jgi:glycosyltransferase involved in cell wall biosynthesis
MWSHTLKQRPMRVVHVVPALFGNEGVYGGAERYALELARAMADLVPTRLVAFGAKPLTRSEGNLRIEVVRNLIPYRRFVFDPVGPGLLPHLAWANVIHYHQTHTFMASVSAAVARISGRLVFTTHLGGAGFGLHRLVNTTNWYHGHLHISRFSLTAFGHTTLPRATIIGGGIDTDRFCPPLAAPKRDFVLYAGRFLPHKGIDYLIEAVPSGLPLVLAGRPWRHAAKFHARLKELAQGKDVTFAENCTDVELRTLYQNALCIVLPSVYRSSDGGEHSIPELLGQTPLEGMACGTPAVCTEVTSLPEVVAEGETGFVVPPNNAAALREKLLWLRDHPAEVAEMGRAARERVLLSFAWPAVVNRCVAAYSRVI